MTKEKIAYLFPGQGAQYPGMGQEFAASFSIAKETFEEADDLLGENLSQVIFEGPEELLTQTKYSQLGIFVVSMAILRTIAQQVPDMRPIVCAGLSLGEYSALCASGKLAFKDTLLLVRERARLMNRACETTTGAMAAVLGLNSEEIEQALSGCSGIWVANYNCPGQTVISGTLDGMEKAGRILKERGAKRVLPLTVHGAFHSGLMQSAQDGLAPLIAAAPISESSIVLVMNVPGALVVPVSQIKECLTRQVTHSIRWEQGIRSMEGIELFFEIGCGKTLTGLNKKIGVAGTTFSIERPADLEQIGDLCNC